MKVGELDSWVVEGRNCCERSLKVTPTNAPRGIGPAPSKLSHFWLREAGISKVICYA